MTEGGKNAIKKTGDHNWDMERMQFQKERGNVSSGSDYINMNSNANDVNEAEGDSRGGGCYGQRTNTDSNSIADDGSLHKRPQKEDSNSEKELLF